MGNSPQPLVHSAAPRMVSAVDPAQKNGVILAVRDVHSNWITPALAASSCHCARLFLVTLLRQGYVRSTPCEGRAAHSVTWRDGGKQTHLMRVFNQARRQRVARNQRIPRQAALMPVPWFSLLLPMRSLRRYANNQRPHLANLF